MRDMLAAVRALLAGGATGSDSPLPASTGPRHSFPLLRRAAVAWLVQVWLLHLRAAPAGSGWAAEARGLLSETLLRLFELHRAGMMARRVVEFMHISKAAGTSMCHLAEVSRCRAQDFGMGRTCIMRDFDDQPRWLNATHHWTAIASVAKAKGSPPYAFLQYGLPRAADRIRTCSGRLAFLQKKKLDFFANEYTVYNEAILANKTSRWGSEGAGAASYGKYVEQLTAEGREGAASPSASSTLPVPWAFAAFPSSASSSSPWASQDRNYSAVVCGTHLCPQFANVVVLREPLDRLMSHLGFIAHTYAGVYYWPGLADAFRPGRGSAEWWRAFAPALADNYVLRTLAGEGAFALPYGALAGGPYMDLARAVLAQYDVVVVLEFDTGDLQRTCAYGLGWGHSLTEFQLRNASHLRHRSQWSDSELVQLLPGEAVMEEFRTLAVRFDRVLYRYGTLLSRLDHVVWRVAEEVLGEPLAGFREGAAPRCGYIHAGSEDGG